MNVLELLATLKTKDIQLAVTDEQLRVNGNKQALSDPALLAALREHKPALIELIKAGQYSASRVGQIDVPANGILPGTTRITPAMVTLADVDQATLDRLLAEVPGGAANVQDIYPLAPLQEGILYHHASNEQGDPYVMQSYFAFSSRERLQDFAQALQRSSIATTSCVRRCIGKGWTYRCKWSGVRHRCRWKRSCWQTAQVMRCSNCTNVSMRGISVWTSGARR